MVGADTPLVAEVQIHFIPWKLCAQCCVVCQKRIESLWGGTAREGDSEGTFFGHGGGGGLDKFLGGAFGDGVEVGQDAYVAWHNFSKKACLVRRLKSDALHFHASGRQRPCLHHRCSHGRGRFPLHLWGARRGLRVREVLPLRLGPTNQRDNFGMRVRATRAIAQGTAYDLEKSFRLDWAPPTGGIIWESAGAQRVPDVNDRLDHAPAGFNHVRTLEEGGIAGHAIAEQALVTSAVFGAEIGAVVEIHIHEAELHDRAGNFCAEAERDAFVGLDVDDQAIRLQIFNRGVAEENERSATELNDDFGGAPLEALAGAEIERHAGPAPVVNLQLHGDEGFGVGVWRDVGLAAIAHDWNSVDSAGTVLPANHAGEHVFGTERLDGMQDFGLLVAHFVGVEGDGRLHCGHGEELEEMVGHHVAEGAGGFVKRAAMLDADRFRGVDLHVVDVVAIPERLDDVVGESKDQNVLDGFLAEIVVDAVNLIFGEDLF